LNGFVIYEEHHGVVTLTLNDHERRNALSTQEQYDAVASACARAQAEHAVKCVIVTGAGSAFCSGGNIKDMQYKTGISGGSPYDIRENYRRGIQRISLGLYHLDVPTIAAVNGPAIGAGCDLACMCDIRIASRKARFAESFVKLGITPGDGGAWLLPRAVGMSKAAEMTFTGDILDADDALACGLVSRVVEPEKLMDEAMALGQRIAANPAPALRMAKKLLREGQHTRLEAALDLAGAYQAIAHFTPEHDKAVIAFVEAMRR
jgi:enoyl-CoA hydratase/carnithine racemase